MGHPNINPFATIEQEVGFTKIPVEYSRPAARWRKQFCLQSNGAPSVVPYRIILCAGTHESTRIAFARDVQCTGQPLFKKTYTFYAFPEEEWEVIFHRNMKHRADGRTNYAAEDNFLISFDGITQVEIAKERKCLNTNLVLAIKGDRKLVMNA